MIEGKYTAHQHEHKVAVKNGVWFKIAQLCLCVSYIQIDIKENSCENLYFVNVQAEYRIAA